MRLFEWIDYFIAVDVLGHFIAKEVQDEVYGRIVKDFKAGYPEKEVLTTPEESVTAMLGTIAKLTKKDSGAFLAQHGDTNWL